MLDKIKSMLAEQLNIAEDKITPDSKIIDDLNKMYSSGKMYCIGRRPSGAWILCSTQTSHMDSVNYVSSQNLSLFTCNLGMKLLP